MLFVGFLTADLSASDLAEDWGWIPERAGILAAESWGIKPQWLGNRLADSYQIQQTTANRPLLVRARVVALDTLPDLPPPVPVPAVPPGFCEIIGEVSDDKLEPVKGAVVEILGTGKTAETDAKGVFTFSAVASGNLTIEASKLGYATDKQTATAMPGQQLTIRMVLRVKSADVAADETMLEEETVVGEYMGDAQTSLIMDLQTSSSVSAGISKEDFTRAAVSDAAGAVSKISGANIVGGRYAVIRGLGDRYSNTTLNGSLISSADPSRKAVQLDLFPSHLLESIKINKTFLPNMPGEFAGGLVAIDTLRFPAEPITQVKIGAKANSNLRDGDNFYAIKGRDLGFLGNSNQGSLPKEGLRLLSNNSGASNTERRQVMESIHSSQGFRPDKVSPNEIAPSMELTFGRAFDLNDGIKFGVMAAFNHERGDEAVTDYMVGRRFSILIGAPTRSFEKDDYTRYVEWGSLLGAGLKIGDHHNIGFTFFTNNNSEDTVTRASRVNTPDTADIVQIDGRPVIQPKIISTPNSIYGPAYAIYRGFDQISPLFRGLDAQQLTGQHAFGEDGRGIKINWGASFSEANEERPHTSTYFFSQLDFADPRIASSTFIERIRNPNAPPAFINVIRPDRFEPERGLQETAGDPLLLIPPDVESFRESLSTRETANNANFSLTLPFYFRDDKEDRAEFSLGAANFGKRRKVRGDFVIYRFLPQFNTDRYLNQADQGQFGIDDAANIDSLTLPNGANRFNGAVNTTTGAFYEDFTGRGFTERNVNASTEVNSLFLMGGLYVNQWEISGGLRRETETRGYELLSETGILRRSDSQTNANDLIGATAIRRFGVDNQHATQLAFGRTIARPTFYEFAPVFTTDQASGDAVAGNPNLVDSIVDNLDIGYSYTPNPKHRYAVNLFHKKVGDPIVKVLNPTGEISWINALNGTIQGIELEASRQLTQHWSLTANYTYITSEQQVRQLSAGRTLEYDSPFEGQPTSITNVILGYDIPDHRVQTSLVYNYTSEFLFALPADPSFSPSVMQRPLHMLDFVVSKGFTAYDVDGTLSFRITNLLDSTIERGMDGIESDLGVFDRFRPGRGFAVSCKLAF